MKRVLAIGVSSLFLFFGVSSISPAQAKMGCPYGGSPNWQGLCDVTTESGESYFGPLIEVPDDPPIPPRELTPTIVIPSTQSNSGTQTQNNASTNIVTSPVISISPNIVGDGNNFYSSVNNTNTTNNTNTNTTTNTVINNTTNSVNNTSNVLNVIGVSGGYLIVGENGFAEFFPSNGDNSNEEPDSSDSGEFVYIEKSDLPVSVLRAVNRIPLTNSVGDSIRLSRILRSAESITENVCTISKRKLTFSSNGQCVLEIVVGNNIYEHEVVVN